jgi:hypothetical protein
MTYPAAWEVQDEQEHLTFLGEGKTSFYLTGYSTEDQPEATQSAAQDALDKLAETFGDFEATELEAFTIGGVSGLTSDYSYTDSAGDLLYGSIIVATSPANNTYIIYIEALADDYEAALESFNPMLQSLTFK